MAISSYQVFLMKGSGTGTITYTKLCDIKDFPKLGGTPEALQTTTLSDAMHTYIPGIQDSEALEFTANYDSDTFDTLAALTGTQTDYAVYFGAASNGTPDGHNGKFTFKGDLSVYVDSGSVNEVVNMKLTITPSTVITKAS